MQDGPLRDALRHLRRLDPRRARDTALALRARPVPDLGKRPELREADGAAPTAGPPAAVEEGHGTLGSSTPAARTPCLSAVIPPGAPSRDGAPDPRPPVPELDAAVVAAADLERGLAMTVAVSPYLVLRSTCSWRVSSGPLLLAIWRRTCTVPAVGGCLLAMTCPTWLCAVPAVGGCLLGHCRLLLDAGPAQYLQYLAMSWHSWACAVPAVGGCLLGLCCLLLDAGGSQPLLALCQL